jgi:hypothetical protein
VVYLKPWSTAEDSKDREWSCPILDRPSQIGKYSCNPIHGSDTIQPMRTGRPSEYTPEVAELICQRLLEGESLNSIVKDKNMPGNGTVFRWLAQREEFREKYARAREAQMDAMAEEILSIADDGSPEEHNWLKLRVDTRKWLMSKLAPKKYGDRTVLAGDKDAPLGVQLIHSVPQPDRGEK